MEQHPQSTWCAAVDTRLFAEHRADVLLVLRLGLAVNALRTQQRFFALVAAAAGIDGQCDRVQAMVQGLGYLREALKLLGHGDERDAQCARGKVARWAKRVGVEAAIEREVAALVDGSHPVSSFITRVRDEHAFHWDKEPLEPWWLITSRSGGPRVWLEGASWQARHIVHRASLDALVFALTPDSGDDLKDVGEFAQALHASGEAMHALATYFNVATVGFLREHGHELYPPNQGEGLSGQDAR